jgi:signal recognition particle GTPase
VAYWLLKHDMTVMIAACDTFRAGAVEQLRTHCRRLEQTSGYKVSRQEATFRGHSGNQ